MPISRGIPKISHGRGRTLKQFAVCAAMVIVFVSTAIAGEGGAHIYPFGAETVLPAVAPPPKQLQLQGFVLFYSASQFNDSQGNSMIPGFRFTEFAQCAKFKYTWDAKFLGFHPMTGGSLVFAYAQVSAGALDQAKANLANQNIDFKMTWNNGKDWFFQYGIDIWTPGPSYTPGDMVNIGAHYWDFEPGFAVTWLPNKGRSELSSRLHYGLNTTNPDNNYHTGSELSWEFDAMQNVSKKVALGVNGYWLHQIGPDTIDGVRVGDGNRTQTLAIGPELRWAVAHGVLAFKYFRETNVRYHPVGNAFWFEFGFPLHQGKTKSK